MSDESEVEESRQSDYSPLEIVMLILTVLQMPGNASAVITITDLLIHRG